MLKWIRNVSFSLLSKLETMEMHWKTSKIIRKWHWWHYIKRIKTLIDKQRPSLNNKIDIFHTSHSQCFYCFSKFSCSFIVGLQFIFQTSLPVSEVFVYLFLASVFCFSNLFPPTEIYHGATRHILFLLFKILQKKYSMSMFHKVYITRWMFKGYFRGNHKDEMRSRCQNNSCRRNEVNMS